MIRELNPAQLGFRGPLLLTGFFESALQQHFMTPDGIFDDALKEVLWRDDNVIKGLVNTKVFIATKIIPNPKKSEFRPAILIDRGEWKRTRIGMYDRDGMGDPVYGDKIDRWEGHHTFQCIGKTYPSCEILGHEVSTFFEVWGQILADQICLDDMSVMGISNPQLLAGENNESYSVTVTVNYQFHNTWSIGNMAPKIRHIRPLITVQDYDGRFEPQTTLTDQKYDG